MQSFKGINQGIQGDVAFTRMDSLPDNVVLATAERGNFVLAHSETGHDHVVAERSATLYNDPLDPLLSFLVVEDTADCVHLRDYNTHGTVQFDKGIYRINRQREYTPKGLRRVAD